MSPARGTSASFGSSAEQGVLQRVPGVARARVDHEARGLIEHDERAVLIDDAQRQALGRQRRLHRQPRLDAHLLPAQHLVLGPQRPALDRDRPRLDPGAQACPGVLGQRLREGLVEAQPGRLRCQREGMGAELLGVPAWSEGRRGNSLYLLVLGDAQPQKGPS